MGTDDHGLGIAARQCCDVTGIGDARLGNFEPAGVSPMLEDWNAEANRELDDGIQYRLVGTIVVIKLHADEVAILHAALYLFERFTRVTRIDEAVTANASRKAADCVGGPLVALAKAVRCRGAFRRQCGAPHLVDAQLVRRIDQLPIVVAPGGDGVVVQVAMRIDRLEVGGRRAPQFECRGRGCRSTQERTAGQRALVHVSPSGQNMYFRPS